MEIKITNIGLVYINSNELKHVSVSFNANSPTRLFTLNGSINLTPTEYEGSEDIESLASIVRTELQKELG